MKTEKQKRHNWDNDMYVPSCRDCGVTIHRRAKCWPMVRDDRCFGTPIGHQHVRPDDAGDERDACGCVHDQRLGYLGPIPVESDEPVGCMTDREAIEWIVELIRENRLRINDIIRHHNRTEAVDK